MTTFQKILTKYREFSFSERDKGARFERLMQAYLQTDPIYAPRFQNVWLWEEFPFRTDFGGKDTGIDLITETQEGDFWAVQCKCYQAETRIDKAAVDTFLSTSGKTFINNEGLTCRFVHRLWIDTTEGGFNSEALKTIQNQNPPVSRIGLMQLADAPVDWEKLEEGIHGEQSRTAKKQLFAHQKTALEKAHAYFYTHDRGKLIMACGTGKTFTSLKIAEDLCDCNGKILFLVPSIALLGQTLREWTAEASEPIKAVCICSDAEVTKVKHQKDDDTDGFTVEDLALPASTNVPNIVQQLKYCTGMTVVFSTYQSIDVISKTQKQLGNDFIFDLIICDEAHRTTGVTLAGAEESAFVKVHNNDFLKARRRMYMTATPRIYAEQAQTKARESDAVLCSMDDPAIYGDEIYRIGFGEAVEKNLLSDYKVLVLTLGEDQVTATLQQSLANNHLEINIDDAAKLIGCINALSKKTLLDSKLLTETDPEPMRRAVAFCQSIRNSKLIKDQWNGCKKAYFETLSEQERVEIVNLSADHVDGSMGAGIRDQKLTWLKEPTNNNECRVLCNVRCLSEGVDVPSLDAVLFLSARNSQVDVVQSVGRVMRRAEGKKYGYIIIPVVIPANVKPEDALNDNERFKVVWTVLNALRAHDDRFNATINKIELNRYKPANILVGGTSFGGADYGDGTNNKDAERQTYTGKMAEQLALKFEQLQGVIYAKMVQKVGDKRYWEQWAADIAKIAQRHIDQINTLIAENDKARNVFDKFLSGLRKNINPSIPESQAVEMLAQHIITQPVFDALFDNYSFAQNNPVSKSLGAMVKLLNEQIDEKDRESLERFYKSVQTRAADIDNAEAKQKIIVELYDKFFKTAFPKVVEQLGIVYTPVEVVDFIIHSVEWVLNKEFSRSLSNENVNIIDPFTGTGTFITRLLQSGIIRPDDLKRKYTKEIKANEIVLLAYYIASINIENVFHDLQNTHEYQPFNGICLTDTFQLGEDDNADRLFSEMFPQNSRRVIDQKKTPIHVVIGNPPYSVGQKSANDNAQNQTYKKLEERIEDCYVKNSNANLNKAVYDSYIKAFRWATDRLDKQTGGIIGFVSNGAWIDSNGLDGFRKSLEKEFAAVYVFNLRGNQRTSGELSRKEGGKIFGSGSRTPIAITILVKQPADKRCRDAINRLSTATQHAKIHYHDIGDYLNREEKLKIIHNFGSIGNPKFEMRTLHPNEHGDWINQRNDKFSEYISIEPGKKFDVKAQSWFNTYVIGVATNRDAWVNGFSKEKVSANMQRMIAFYNKQREQLASEEIKELSGDETKISWTVNLKKDATKNNPLSFDGSQFVMGQYRPFCKQILYYHRPFIERPGLWNQIFPTEKSKNLVISVSGIGQQKPFSSLISNNISDLQVVDKAQYFPLYYYEKNEHTQKTLFDEDRTDEYIRHEAVTDFILQQARGLYGNKVIKEDIFYYVYGFLHAPAYHNTFAADLKKMLPRIPLVEKPQDFWAFSKAGRELAELHLNYESIEPCKSVIVNYRAYEEPNYRVEKMRFVTKGDKSKIQYNNSIVIENIPPEAYEYVVNGKSAIEWIMERYAVTTDSKSGIINNSNDWATEHEDEKYIFNLLLRIINVSVQTVEIVKSLPEVKF